MSISFAVLCPRTEHWTPNDIDHFFLLRLSEFRGRSPRSDSNDFPVEDHHIPYLVSNPLKSL